MIISLLHIVVPTILILVILIPYINSCSRRIMDELRDIRTQLEQLDNVSARVPEKVKEEPEAPAGDVLIDNNNEKEEQDAVTEDGPEVAASEYNTGKSGKIYTKEELELLIKE